MPYRVIQCCTGDIGVKNAAMMDVETWMPSRNGYGETHSGSALRDFQARRLNLRYRKAADGGPKGATQFCYTLNNTAIACPRVLIAILETYQNAATLHGRPRTDRLSRAQFLSKMQPVSCPCDRWQSAHRRHRMTSCNSCNY